MSYIVLARKYRPKSFSELLGQSHVTQTLENAFRQNKVAQAYLFTGTRGVGKTSLGRILAKALRCEDPKSQVGKEHYGQACHTCPSCLEIGESRSLDVLEIDGASNNGVDNVRELRESIRFLPVRGAKKIYIIDEVHMLTGAAFNALLKTLEEPPSHATFVFATTETQKIPATILSRCQRFDLKRVSRESIAKHLHKILEKEKIKAQASVIELISRRAQGSVRDALSLLDQAIALCGTTLSLEKASSALGVINLDLLIAIWKYAFTKNPIKAIERLSEAHEAGISMKRIAVSLAELTRDALWIKLGGGEESLEILPEKEEKLCKIIKVLSMESLQTGFELLSRSVSEILHSSLPKTQLEITLIRLSQIDTMESISSLLEKLEDLDKRISFPTFPKPTVSKEVIANKKREMAPYSPNSSSSSPSVPKEGLGQWKDFILYVTRKHSLTGSLLGHALNITPMEDWKKEESKCIRIGFPGKKENFYYKQATEPKKISFIQEMLSKFTGSKKELKIELIEKTNSKEQASRKTLDKKNREEEKERKEKVIKEFKNKEIVQHAEKVFHSNFSQISVLEKKEEE